jgi:hypothetical protein
MTSGLSTILGCIFVILLGSYMHFLYDQTGNNKVAGIIAPVNESVISHLKLILWPWMLYMIVDVCISKGDRSLTFASNVSGILMTMSLIASTYYMFVQISRRTHNLGVLISLFVVSVIFGFMFKFGLDKLQNLSTNVWVLGFIVLTWIVVYFGTQQDSSWWTDPHEGDDDHLSAISELEITKVSLVSIGTVGILVLIIILLVRQKVI